ncbi:MAG: hypothetical protein MHM6MM_004388 [Cercozoa sp. M6MM]
MESTHAVASQLLFCAAVQQFAWTFVAQELLTLFSAGWNTELGDVRKLVFECQRGFGEPTKSRIEYCQAVRARAMHTVNKQLRLFKSGACREFFVAATECVALHDGTPSKGCHPIFNKFRDCFAEHVQPSVDAKTTAAVNAGAVDESGDAEKALAAVRRDATTRAATFRFLPYEATTELADPQFRGIGSVPAVLNGIGGEEISTYE